MAKVIAFATSKGGAGKSTLLMLTAAALHNRTDKKVLVIDSDPQRSIKEVYKKENSDEAYDVIAFNWKQPKAEVNFQKTIELAERKYDVIMLDVPGKLEGKENYFSILISDILMVPVTASSLDISATMKFLDTIPTVKEVKEGHGYKLDVFGVINKKDQTLEHRYLKDLAGNSGLQLFYSPISNLVRYRRKISTVNDITDASVVDDEFNMYFDEFRTKCNL